MIEFDTDKIKYSFVGAIFFYSILLVITTYVNPRLVLEIWPLMLLPYVTLIVYVIMKLSMKNKSLEGKKDSDNQVVVKESED